uniref:PPM-type phosphatase domain-containing protein n=1 Tax=Strigamia maritima TaxID=126957 RepID=T1JP78_STRMM
MDDDLEDELFHQTFLSHMRFLSKIVTNSPLNAAPFIYTLRILKFYLLKPETILLGFCLLVLFFFFHSLELWLKTVVNRIQIAVGLQTAARSGLRFLVSNAAIKSEWKLKEGNAAVYAIQGRRPTMEDRFNIITDVEKTGISLYGVFDGHGGQTASDFVEKRLFKSLSERLVASNDGNTDINYAQILTEEILNVDKELITIAKQRRDIAGTTAIVALQHKNKLVVANVGDSRGVICDNKGNAIPLSFDHKPQMLKERKRIKKAGGFVAFNGVWRVAGILATSRALGDYPLKDRNLVIAEPDVLTFNLDDLKPQFMILASDGLWDTFTNSEAIEFVRSRLNGTLNGAWDITHQAFLRGSVDNITVIVVNFKNDTAVKVSSSAAL